MSQPPFSVRALYPYESDVDGDLTFDAHQIITVDVIEDDEWYSGSFTDSGTGQRKSGIFPRNFVETIKVEPTPVKDQEEEDEEEEEEDTGDVAPAKAPAKEEPPAAVAVPKSVPVPVPAPMPAQAPAAAPAPIKSPPSHSISPPTVTPASNQATSPEVVATSPPPKKRNAFQDRIAAFNSSNAAPSPFAQPKPSTYSKKPFHAVPTNSYVPQMPFAPKPAKAPAPPPPPTEVVHPDDSDEEEKEAMPKMSLKERIKLLQQQQEAEAARSEALAAKKKQKAKQKAEERAVVDEEGELTSPAVPVDSIDSHATLEAAQTGGSLASVSRDLEEEDEAPLSREVAASPESHPQPPVLDPRAKLVQQAPLPAQEEEEEEEEDESEDEEDEEEARRLALRERMAKISGGMGMPMGMGMGMMLPGGFGAPAPPKPPKKKKAVEEVAAPAPVPVMVPVLPFANPAALPPSKPAEDEDEDEDDEEEEEEKDAEEVISKTLEHVSLDKPELSDMIVSKQVAPQVSKAQTEHIEPVAIKQAVPMPEAEVLHTGSPTKTELPMPPVPPVHRSPLPEPTESAAKPPASTEANRGLGSIIAANKEDSDSEDSDGAWSEKESPRKPEPVTEPAKPAPPAVPVHTPVPVVVPAPIVTQDHQQRTLRM